MGRAVRDVQHDRGRPVDLDRLAVAWAPLVGLVRGWTRSPPIYSRGDGRDPGAYLVEHRVGSFPLQEN